MNGFLPQQVFRYCPRCGSGNFHPDSVKSMQCADCGFQYFFNLVAAVAGLIYDDDGNLLLTYRANEPAKGELDLPGGFIDMGEDATEALFREIKEELNLDVISSEYYHSFPNEYIYGGITYFTLDLVFRCKVISFENIKAADDVAGYVFMPQQDINPDDIGLSSIKDIIISLQKP
ncbi:MAG: NUDIX domain-containing protein [Bacteroidetes bacterium]|nr:NUDIX domain-containing protein [Bacteroidota bacterium]